MEVSDVCGERGAFAYDECKNIQFANVENAYGRMDSVDEFH